MFISIQMDIDKQKVLMYSIIRIFKERGLAILLHIQSKLYRLTEPGVFKRVEISKPLGSEEVVVEPTQGSICNADLRYFSGQRRQESLREKLPMALIHEGIGRIVNSNNVQLPTGTRVVIVPNIPGYLLQGKRADECCPICQKENGQNYCEHGRFLGSGYDGITQSKLVMPSACVVPIPHEVPDEIAVLSELCTVSYQALLGVSNKLKQSKVAVFGDGPVGYVTATMIRYLYNLQENQLTVFGADHEKLKNFDFATCCNVQDYDFSKKPLYDIAIDCTGGKFSKYAINQAIDILNPLGEIILMGVSEEKVAINTRDVLEKGITLRGSSRSSYADYPPVLEAMKSLPYQKALEKLLPKEKSEIRSIDDLNKVMKHVLEKRGWKKTILKFHW